MVEKAQTGTWTLTAPDGRTWTGESPLRTVAMERADRLTPVEQLGNLCSSMEGWKREEVPMTLKGYHKVPFRQVYCVRWRDWLAEVILCHVVYRLSPLSLPSMG